MPKLPLLQDRSSADPPRAALPQRTSTGLARSDADALATELRRLVKGEVRFDPGTRALYATDASNYRQVPIGVVVPRDVDDVVTAVTIARRFGAPLLSRGGGTSLAGQCCNAAVILDFSKYVHRVLHVDSVARLGTAQPGCVLDDLRAAAEPCHLTFGPDPATHKHCTIGGMLGNNSCGIHSLLSAKHGLGLRTSDNTHELEILTYRGDRFRVGPTSPEALEQIIRAGGPRGAIYARLKSLRDRYRDAIRGMPKLPRRVSGYNLDELLPEKGFHVARALAGSESTLVTILEATLHLVPRPQARSLLVLGYPDVFASGDHVPDILPFEPIGLEGLDHLLIAYIRKKGDSAADLKLLPEGTAFLLVEFGGGDKEDSDEQARRCMAALGKQANAPQMKLFDDPQEEEKLWHVRESGLGATAFVPGLPDMWPGWEDSAVPPERVGAYLRGLRGLFDQYGYNPSLYGHFGQGCIHCRVDFDLYSAEGIRTWRAFLDDAADLVVRHGGSLSGEHGDGQARGELLSRMYGPELMRAFREFKEIWDPDGKMNPGKGVDAAPVTSNLRLGPDYAPLPTTTHFQFPEDQGTFSRAVLRCVGVGKCRNHDDQTMCPSYMVTREERHSTRGRARLLWEMLNGHVLTDGWCSAPVHEALDLCLACKGCKHDCPVNVDMATYKAEFLAHYYEGRLRPRHAYAFGFIHRWARLANRAPALANFFSQTPGLRRVAAWVADVSPWRRLPPFAKESFQHWAAQHHTHRPASRRVVLWPDTFCNYFHPEIARAATEVLESAGFRVDIPQADMCCGRPLYDFGFLKTARMWLRDVLDKLQEPIRAGIPVVVLEPSCAAVFKDELVNLLPNDKDAQRLHDQTYLLADFLTEHAPHFEPPTIEGRALLHGHCHQKALSGLQHDQQLLERMGLTVRVPETGCCGMAGAFGFQAGEHYRVSVACGERVLLPEVRRATADTLIVADGFSCREQVTQTTSREPLHLAQVLQMATARQRAAQEARES